MKVLLINNNSKHFIELKKLLKKHSSYLRVISYNNIKIKEINRYDLIVLSGGQRLDVPDNRYKLRKEIQLIKNAKKPILGVCLGFELIADTFGSKLKKRKERISGIINVNVLRKDKIFGNMKKFNVFVSHKWYVQKLSKDLICLGRSEEDIEVIKHKNKEIYGVQFHPEVDKGNNQGKKILINLIKSLSK